ncbi:MAG: class A beta-lactamase, subclass A2, partial [Flavobacteriaceae bacterium]|nr:class A beta-lactamase, subclass A2 [Flavobacteriaceae bacterium]
MNVLKNILILTIFPLGTAGISAQIGDLEGEIKNVIHDKKATIGVSIIANNYQDTININENLHYPMLSVFKFPIAMAVLAEVDKGKFSLNQKIKITTKDLLPNTTSPIRDKFPNGTEMPLGDIIKYTVSQSDNNGCDILLRLIGGTKVIEKFLLKNQLTDISIKANEEKMHKSWDVQYKNWATPISLNHLLTEFYNNKTLSKESHEFLWKIMVETSTGPNRLKGQLPKNIVIAHKTGTSFTNDEGVTAATNDIGIIVLPNGNPVFISVLVSDSSENE